MRSGISPKTRLNPYAKRINREPSPLLANTVPYLSIIIASIVPALFVASTIGMVPPLGFVMLVAWRLMRPGLLPNWAGLPLGAVDDLFSGQPFGSAILLWSLTMLIIEWFEARFPWRGFWQDWVVAILAISANAVLSLAFSGASPSLALIGSMTPQWVISIAMFPIIAGLVAWLDRLRLRRIREVA